MTGTQDSTVAGPGDQSSDLAAFGRELFARLARSQGRTEAEQYEQTALPDCAVLVAEKFRGGGRIYVAVDRTVLFVGSSLGSAQALAAFRSGRRTPIESFGSEAA